MIAAGVALEDPELKQRGLELLEWLLDYETTDGHLSPTPVGGRGPQDSRPAFDQQPIEVATLADACARAAAADPRALWLDGIRSCAAWFEGVNDSGLLDVGHGDRRRIRRVARRLRQPQPGRRIDPCGDLHLAARAALFAGSTMTLALTGLVSRDPHRIAANPGRVITQLFVPGQEGFELQESRAGVVLKRILALTDDEVLSSLDDVIVRFDGRHRDLVGTFRRHAHELADRLDPDIPLSDARMLLLGATFTSEYSIEGAALCNPSIVAHPDQTDVRARQPAIRDERAGDRGRAPLVHRVPHRCCRRRGPGHASTSRRGSRPPEGCRTRCSMPRCSAANSAASATPAEAANYVFDALGDRFTRSDLDARLDNLRANLSTRGHGERAVALIRTIAARSYAVEFPSDVPLSERVLWPSMEAEQAGMEDARFVRFVDDDGSVTYYATYTAYSGSHISQQLLTTKDFQSFTSGPLVGKAAANKGLALFPRRIHGRYAAMSRSDRETNTVAFADHLAVWTSASPCQQPAEAWEVLQLGNCGPPIETEAGWLVLTHGVGPMRTYNIGAILLDLDDPTTVLGRLRRPLLSPARDEQNGYVPNVVYSCGALVHADTLVIPYGINDGAIGIATAPLSQLLATMVR